jgi:hypothetical protein
VDGDMVEHVAEQLARVPGDASHLVVSVGGNDALSRGGMILHDRADSVAEVLLRLGEIGEEFRADYRRMLDAVLARGRPVTVCTIYDSVPGLGLGEIGEEFRSGYRRMFDAVLSRGKPVTVCTIYDSVPGLEVGERAGLCVFNDGSRARRSGGGWT